MSKAIRNRKLSCKPYPSGKRAHLFPPGAQSCDSWNNPLVRRHQPRVNTFTLKTDWQKGPTDVRAIFKLVKNAGLSLNSWVWEVSRNSLCFSELMKTQLCISSPTTLIKPQHYIWVRSVCLLMAGLFLVSEHSVLLKSMKSVSTTADRNLGKPVVVNIATTVC